MFRRISAAVITAVLLVGVIASDVSPTVANRRISDAATQTNDSARSPVPAQVSMDRAVAEVAKTQISSASGLVSSQNETVPLETAHFRPSIQIKGQHAGIIKQLHVFRI